MKEYSIEQISEALKAVNEGMTVKQAAEKYNIPNSTLHDKFKGKSSLNAKKGRPSFLSEEEEKE